MQQSSPQDKKSGKPIDNLSSNSAANQQVKASATDKKSTLATGSGALFGGGLSNNSKTGFSFSNPTGAPFHGKGSTFGGSSGGKKGVGKRSGPIGGGGQKRSGSGGARGR